MNNKEQQARKRFEEETKDMNLEGKLKWVETTLFYIEIDDYIKDKDTWREYLKIKDELVEEIKKQGDKDE